MKLQTTVKACLRIQNLTVCIFGIVGMGERAAEVGAVVNIERRPEGGTRVTLAIPKGTGVKRDSQFHGRT